MEEEESRSGVKILISFIFILLVISSLILYWFLPFNTIEFGVKPEHSNFSINDSSGANIQFYQNMRFPDSRISYKIIDCPLKKRNDMENAFDIISDKTLLKFYLVESNEEISVTCDSKTKIEQDLFIVGEGGPTNITRAGKFNVILHGTILLIRESKCERPNIALHELLHVLGFEHSRNPNNIMYEISECKQVTGDDIIELINKIYSTASYPDLSFENVSAVMNGRYLDANISIRNNGLEKSHEAKMMIYADDKFIKEIKISPIDIGYGSTILLNNILIKKINVKELSFLIDYSSNELKKENNKIMLEIKNKKN